VNENSPAQSRHPHRHPVPCIRCTESLKMQLQKNRRPGGAAEGPETADPDRPWLRSAKRRSFTWVELSNRKAPSVASSKLRGPHGSEPRSESGLGSRSLNPRSEAWFREHKEPRSAYRLNQAIASQSCRARSSQAASPTMSEGDFDWRSYSGAWRPLLVSETRLILGGSLVRTLADTLGS
jgi:hypothetical protein